MMAEAIGGPSPQMIPVLEAALGALKHLVAGWRHQAQVYIDQEDYSPEQVNWILRSWESLQTGAEGGTGGSYDGSGGGKHDRLELAAMLADVALATDRALADRLHWRSAQRIYRRQGRELSIERIGAFTRAHFGRLRPEPGAPYGYQDCVEAIAAALGWSGYVG